MGIKETVLKFALLNAVRHEGRGEVNPVVGRVLSERPDLKPRIKELIKMVAAEVKRVNAMGLERQKKLLEDRWPELLVEERVEEKALPPLPNVSKYPEVRTRFAPNPDAPLHLGNARPLILCHEYARMHKGRFILRYEDTSPSVKPPILEVYDVIREDLEWLGATPDETCYQSDRLGMYYKYAKRGIELGKLYVCMCKPDRFKELCWGSKPCPCRDLPPSEHMERWEGMLNGKYAPGEAVVRVKTDLDHSNPAVREWPALRIDETPHPRTGTDHRVWPLYNWSSAIDDHDLKITHILRGKEHEVNTIRQRFLYGYFGWDYPEAIHMGRLSIEGGVLSKSKIREGIEIGRFRGWDDPRLFTLMALKRRGIQPGAIRSIMMEVGVKPVNVTVSLKTLEAHNRAIVEPIANRYFFISDVAELVVSGLPKRRYVSRPHLHPSYPERGSRSLTVKVKDGAATLAIERRDAKRFKKGDVFRLMGLFNVRVDGVEKERVLTSFYSEAYLDAKKLRAPLIHWLPSGVGVKTSVVMPDGSTLDGIAETDCRGLRPNDIIQFERFGFVRIDRVDPQIIAYFTNR